MLAEPHPYGKTFIEALQYLRQCLRRYSKEGILAVKITK